MIELKINGKTHLVDIESETPLLWAIRDTVGLTGTKYGCGIEQCGACTVLIEKRPVRSCGITVGEVVGKNITTIEGLSSDSSHPVQKAWITEQVPQCGYCQSGQIMQAAALLESNKNPSRDEIVAYMNGNICRCGTYLRIIRAIKIASAELTKDK